MDTPPTLAERVSNSRTPINTTGERISHRVRAGVIAGLLVGGIWLGGNLIRSNIQSKTTTGGHRELQATIARNSDRITSVETMLGTQNAQFSLQNTASVASHKQILTVLDRIEQKLDALAKAQAK